MGDARDPCKKVHARRSMPEGPCQRVQGAGWMKWRIHMHYYPSTWVSWLLRRFIFWRAAQLEFGTCSLSRISCKAGLAPGCFYCGLDGATPLTHLGSGGTRHVWVPSADPSRGSGVAADPRAAFGGAAVCYRIIAQPQHVATHAEYA